MTEPGYEPLADAQAIAAWLQVSPATVRSWAHRGRIQAQGHDGRRTLYSVIQAATLIKTDTLELEDPPVQH